ncbi:MAG: PAS domain-containing protein [Methanolobus sp.]|nr:PAS domain-containing protein [Methanolobus sp.]
MESKISNENGTKDTGNKLNEVTDRKQLLEKIIDNSPVIIFLWKTENRSREKWHVEYVSSNVGLFGYTMEDFISGRLVYTDIVLPADLRMLENVLTQRCMEGVDFFNQQYRIILKSGDVRWVDERTCMQRDDAGNITHCQATIIDITEQKNREIALEKTLMELKPLEDVVNNSSTMVFLWRAELFWPADYASKNVSRLGYSAEDFMLGRIVYSDLIHPDDYEMVKNTLEEECKNDSNNYNQEYRVITKDGNLLWVSENTFILRDMYGNVTHFQGIVRDITKQKESEIALKIALEKQDELLKRKQALETVVNHSPMITFLWKAGSDDEKELWPVEFVSDNISNLGYSVDDFLSGNILYGDIIDPDDLPYVQMELSDVAREGGKVFVKEYRIKTKSKEQRWVEEQTFIQRNNDGVVTNYQGIIQDITERREKN